MSYKVDEATLMAYLYGELSSEEKKKVEAYLDENESARKELDALEEARWIMGKVQEREVEVPQFTFDQSNVVVGSATQHWWKFPMGIAASIALLIFVGYLTSFRISTGAEGLEMAFGSATSTEEVYTKAEVQEMLAEALAANNQLVSQQLSTVQQTMHQQVAEQVPNVDEALLNEYMARLRDFNRDALQSMLENSEQSQRDYMDQSLQELAVFLDIQRRNDLDVIQTQFTNLAEDTEYNQLQTNQILTNLISSVEEQPSNQY